MTDEFITTGIENDRYLKAVRLYKQFEEEVYQKLHNATKNAIEAKPEWFPAEPEHDQNLTRQRTEPLGHIRVDTEMAKANAAGEPLIFHVCLEWTKPGVRRHAERTDGNLCIVFYKIKHLQREVYEDIRKETKADDGRGAIHFDDDLWNSNLGIFYIPVEGGPEITAAFETLIDHFIEFGDAYGELPDSTNGN